MNTTAAFDCIFKFAYVPGPIVRGQGQHRFLAEAVDCLLFFSAYIFKKCKANS